MNPRTPDWRRPALLALAALLLPAAAARPAQAGEGAPELVLGEWRAGTLAETAAGAARPAACQFRLQLAAETELTLCVESLDFNVNLQVQKGSELPGTLEFLRGPYTDERVTLRARAGELRVAVFAEDGRGGAFRLRAQSGRASAPDRGEFQRASARRCEEVAQAARQAHENARALLVLKDGFQFALEARELELARRLVRLASSLGEDPAAAPLERLRARAQASILDLEEGAGEAARAELCATLAEIDALELPASGPARSRALLASFVLDALARAELGRAGLEHALLEHLERSLRDARALGHAGFEARALARRTELACLEGDACRARESAESVLALAERVQDPALLAQALSARAASLLFRGDPRAAQADLRRALGLDPAPALRAELLARAAQAAIAEGDCAAALSALAELETLSGTLHDARLAPQVLLLRARAHEALGSFAEAEAWLEQSRDEALRAGLSACAAEAELDRALLRLRLGSAREAREELTLALARLGDEQASGLGARLHRALAETLDAQGEFELARREFRAAAALARGADDRLGELLARAGEAWELQRAGELDAARALLAEVEPALERDELWWAAADAQDTLARIALARADVAALDEALEAGRGLLARVVRPELVRDARRGVRSRFAGFGELEVEAAWLRCEAARADPVRREELARAGWRRASAWKARVLLEGLASRRRGCDDALPTLGAQEACVDYAAGVDALYAFVTRGTRTTLQRLGARSEIEANARELVQALSRRGLELSAAEFAALAARCHADLLAPLEQAGGPLPRLLLVVPSPELANLPFDCLVEAGPPAQAGAPRFADLVCVIDRHELRYAPSAAVAAELELPPSPGRAPRLLVVADPRCAGEFETGAARSDLPGRLRGARDEADAIVRMVFARDERVTPEEKLEFLSQTGRDASLESAAMSLYAGAQASRAKLAAGLERYTHLHFAVHGRVDPLDPRRSGLLLDWQPSDSGFWGLEDVLAHPLDAELVVLSACATADGPLVRGEGLQSLANAFLEAGARAVVATGWDVNDRQTVELMTAFYRGMLGEKLEAGAALRSARLALRASSQRGGAASASAASEPDLAHPSVWGAWFHVGRAAR